ncbi:hypothetical protein B0T17DRAFT_387615 [Bombardia bombarda]|uniref:Uncharacterized protein n=1 Tax=Bombardia bombarda TaxID=252184 RepID=A0AA39TQ22_9PEZI|nr:hypothetical protein B0T17DRAFT_387615 [Bombardia bombarda]
MAIAFLTSSSILLTAGRRQVPCRPVTLEALPNPVPCGSTSTELWPPTAHGGQLVSYTVHTFFLFVCLLLSLSDRFDRHHLHSLSPRGWLG